MVKSTIDVHVSLLTKINNSSIQNECFLDELKAARVTPIFKKNDDLDRENYRPVSVFSHASKFIERLMHIQIENVMEEKLSKLLTVSGKTIAPNIVQLIYLKNGKTLLMKALLFVPCSWTCQKPLTQWTMIC